MSTVRVRYTTDQVTLIATNEDQIYTLYDSAEAYIESVFQYITADTYMRVNRVEKLSEVNPAEYKALLAEVEVLGNAG